MANQFFKCLSSFELYLRKKVCHAFVLSFVKHVIYLNENENLKTTSYYCKQLF
jgi:hypothetical protein